MTEETPQARSQEGQIEQASILSTVGLVVGVLGLSSALFGVAVYAIIPSATQITIINLIFATGAIVFYGATNWSKVTRLAAGRSTPLVILEVVLIVGTILAAVAVNYFAHQSSKEWDLTRDQLYTLQEQTQNILARIKKDVRVIGVFQPNNARRVQLSELVSLYQKTSPRISLEFLNPVSITPAQAKKYSLATSELRIIVESEDGRQVKLKDAREEDLTNALIQLVEKPERKVSFLSGHREGTITDEKSKYGYQRAAQDLIDDGYLVEELSLADKEKVPKDVSVLVLAGPRDRLLPHEAQSILAWLKTGGRVVLLIEPGIENGLEAIFRPFGVEVGDNLIIDPNPASRALGFSRGDAPIVNKFEQHPITDPLQGTTVLFYWVRSVSPRIGLARIEATTLIQTSETSWGETNYASNSDVELDEADVPGPVPIAVAVTMKTTSNPNRINEEARLVVIGDSSFASNNFYNEGANADLFNNTINWLSGDEAKISIRPRRRGSSRIPLTEQQHAGIVFFSVNLLPLLIVGAGLSVWAIRRRK
jgi:ABC-type uncharacterized transport system involved in gliding motility auxiliary subunit